MFVATVQGHIVKTTKRSGLKVVCSTYCGKDLNAADGVHQVVMNEGVCRDCRLAAGVKL